MLTYCIMAWHGNQRRLTDEPSREGHIKPRGFPSKLMNMKTTSSVIVWVGLIGTLRLPLARGDDRLLTLGDLVGMVNANSGNPSGYASDTRPNYATAGPAGMDTSSPATYVGADEILTQIDLGHILSVDQKGGTIQVEGYDRMWWWDKRLAMEDTDRWFCPMKEHLMQCSNLATCKGYQQDSCMALSADEDDIDNVWTPEIFVENQVDTRGTTITDQSVMVYNNGYVFRERRFIWTLSCKMNFENLPFDTQKCPIKLDPNMASPYYHLVLKLAEEPLRLSDELIETGTPEWDVSAGESSELREVVKARKSQKFDVGFQMPDFQYAKAEFMIVLTRKPYSYEMTFVFPVTIFMLLSYVSFWLRCGGLHTRVIMCYPMLSNCRRCLQPGRRTCACGYRHHPGPHYDHAWWRSDEDAAADLLCHLAQQIHAHWTVLCLCWAV
jgi:hypothetical protein